MKKSISLKRIYAILCVLLISFQLSCGGSSGKLVITIPPSIEYKTELDSLVKVYGDEVNVMALNPHRDLHISNLSPGRYYVSLMNLDYFEDIPITIAKGNSTIVDGDNLKNIEAVNLIPGNSTSEEISIYSELNGDTIPRWVFLTEDTLSRLEEYKDSYVYIERIHLKDETFQNRWAGEEDVFHYLKLRCYDRISHFIHTTIDLSGRPLLFNYDEVCENAVFEDLFHMVERISSTNSSYLLHSFYILCSIPKTVIEKKDTQDNK